MFGNNQIAHERLATSASDKALRMRRGDTLRENVITQGVRRARDRAADFGDDGWDLVPAARA